MLPRAANRAAKLLLPIPLHHRVLLNGGWLRLFRQHGREVAARRALAHVQGAPHQSLSRQLILRGVFLRASGARRAPSEKNSRCRKQQRQFSWCCVRWSGVHLCSAHCAHHAPRCIRSCAALLLFVRCCCHCKCAVSAPVARVGVVSAAASTAFCARAHARHSLLFGAPVLSTALLLSYVQFVLRYRLNCWCVIMHCCCLLLLPVYI